MVGDEGTVDQAAIHSFLVLQVVEIDRTLEALFALEDGGIVQVLAGQVVFEDVGATQLVDGAEAHAGVVVNDGVDQPHQHVYQRADSLHETKSVYLSLFLLIDKRKWGENWSLIAVLRER